MPRPTYEQLVVERRAERDRLTKRERSISMARLVAIVVTLGTAWLAGWWALLPAIAFIVLLVLHDRALVARGRVTAAVTFYERGLARLAGAWAGKGDAGTEFIDEHHPYASDLDLFGRGSLFELISLARTRAGRRRLADWLLQPTADAEHLAARQVAVADLRTRLALREELAILASEVAGDVEAAQLDRWATAEPIVVAPWERAFVRIAAVVATLAFIASLPTFISELVHATHGVQTIFDSLVGAVTRVAPIVLVVAIIAERYIARRLRPRTDPIIAGVERAEPALALLARLLGRLERERFDAPELQQLHAALARNGVSSSEQIERLRKLVSLLDARRNQFFAPFAALMLWTTNVALSIERWRAQSGGEVVNWIEAVGTIEALASLASFAFEHPDFVTPEIVPTDSPDAPLFQATALAHPLIPADRRVANDLRLDRHLRLIVISGSNMSGKSTMLRSTGVAVVLAQAGAVVCAGSLRISPLRLGASIGTHDSLQEGTSRFYAEILRIRQILELAGGTTPLLFLLDEILHGTNSHDRRIGAEAVVRGLVARDALGLVSTHDLALTHIAEALAPRASNVHFEDHLEEGRMHFDYRMQPGVVEKSNALALMRAVGIEV